MIQRKQVKVERTVDEYSIHCDACGADRPVDGPSYFPFSSGWVRVDRADAGPYAHETENDFAICSACREKVEKLFGKSLLWPRD